MKILACDRCQKPAGKDRTIHTFFVVTDRHLDAAGSSDDFGENVDVCGACVTQMLGNVLADRDYERNKRILAWIRRDC